MCFMVLRHMMYVNMLNLYMNMLNIKANMDKSNWQLAQNYFEYKNDSKHRDLFTGCTRPNINI